MRAEPGRAFLAGWGTYWLAYVLGLPAAFGAVLILAFQMRGILEVIDASRVRRLSLLMGLLERFVAFTLALVWVRVFK